MSLLLALSAPSADSNLSGAIVESPDEVSGAVGLALSITSAVTEGSDVAAGGVSLSLTVTGAITEGSDAVAGEVDLVTPAIEVSGDVLEGSDGVEAVVALTPVAGESTFGPWCVGGDDKPKHTFGNHPFFRSVDLPADVAQEIESLAEEQQQVAVAKQQSTEATDRYWALQAHEQMLRLEAERITTEAIRKAQLATEMDIAFVAMMLEEG